MKNNKIIGQRVYLRLLHEKDASEKYCDWLNDVEVNKFLETKKMCIGDLRAYIMYHTENKNSSLIGIFDKNNNKHIGNSQSTYQKT